MIPLLGKIRSAFTIASPLTLAGKQEATVKVYMRVANNVLSADARPYINSSKLASFEDTVNESKTSKDTKELAWMLRRDLEGIYDDMIDRYCGLTGVGFDPVHKKVSHCIEVCQPLVKSGRYKEANRIYRKVAEDILSAASNLSSKAVVLLNQALSSTYETDNKETASKIRKSLDYVYEEFRLPDVYIEATSVSDCANDSSGKQVLLFGGAQLGEGLEYEAVTYTDKLVDGSSVCEFVGLEDGKNLGIFRGNISAARNGGFAGVRLVPIDQSSFKQLTFGCKGLSINVRNMGSKTERIKVTLPSQKNAKAFSWQCDVLLPLGEESQQIYLPFLYFWPSLFGHVLARNGNVDLEKVDAVGFLLSKITQNGKPNPEFAEGKFAIKIESIYGITDF